MLGACRKAAMLPPGCRCDHSVWCPCLTTSQGPAGFVAPAFAEGRNELLALCLALCCVLLPIIIPCPSAFQNTAGWGWHSAQEWATSTSSTTSLLCRQSRSPCSRAVLFLCCCCCFSFTDVHFSLPPTPPWSKKLSCISAQRTPFFSFFFLCSSSTIPSRWCETLDLFPLLSYLGGQFGTLQLMLSPFLETLMWQQDRLINRLSHYVATGILIIAMTTFPKWGFWNVIPKSLFLGRERCSNNKMFHCFHFAKEP